ncbi:MAG: hypothetical protein V1697_02575 [Candidatus Levyibacteriota bacterium]
MSTERQSISKTKLQAKCIARIAGITLTDEQIGLYVKHRLGFSILKTSGKLSMPRGLSDQKLLERLLTPRAMLRA